MSLASILIQEEMNGTTFEDDSVPYDSVSMDELNAYISMESCSHELDSIAHAQSGVFAIYDELESTNRLSMEANEYLGLALDAALGKQETIYLKNRPYKTHENIFTMEASTDLAVIPSSNEEKTEENKKSLLSRIWSMFIAGLKRIAEFFKNVGASVMLLFDKLGRYDKKLEKLKKQVSSYTPPSEYTMPKKLAASLADDSASSMKDIIDLVSNLNSYCNKTGFLLSKNMTTHITIVQSDEIDSRLAEQNLQEINKISEVDTDISLPGNQVLETRQLNETLYGKILIALANGRTVNSEAHVVVKTTGERPDKEIKFTSAPSINDIENFLDNLSFLSKSISGLKTLQKPLEMIKKYKIPTAKKVDVGIKERINDKKADIKETLRLRSAMVTSPLLRFPVYLVRECFRVYGAGLNLTSSIMKGNTSSK